MSQCCLCYTGLGDQSILELEIDNEINYLCHECKEWLFDIVRLAKDREFDHILFLYQKHVEPLMKSIDLMSRIGLKQYRAITDHISKTKDCEKDLSYHESILIQTVIRSLEGFKMEENASYGIMNDEVDNKYRVCLPIFHALRNLKKRDSNESIVHCDSLIYDNESIIMNIPHIAF